MQSRPTSSQNKTEGRGALVLSISVAAVLLVVVTAGATLWATGSFSRMRPGAASPPSANPPTIADTPGSPQGSELNLAIFDPVHRLVAELRAGQDIGVNREKFQGLLQQFSTELILVAEKAESPAERRITEAYRQVLEIYKDSAAIWDVKISVPSVQDRARRYVDALVSTSNESRIRGWDFIDACFTGLPLDLFPKGSTGLDQIAARYSIPVTEEKGWRIIPNESIQDLWEKAAHKMEEVKRFRNG
jgi:hypothetical protein